MRKGRFKPYLRKIEYLHSRILLICVLFAVLGKTEILNRDLTDFILVIVLCITAIATSVIVVTAILYNDFN